MPHAIDTITIILKKINLGADGLTVKIRFSISTKLIFMGAAIVVAAIAVVVINARILFTDESIAHAQTMNLDIAKGVSEQVRTLLKDATDKTSVMAETVTQFNGQVLSLEAQQFIQNVLRSNDELISFGVYRPDATVGYKELFFAAKDEALAEFDLKLDDLKNKPLIQVENAVGRHPSEVTLFNSSPYFNKPILTVAFLTKKNPDSKERWLVRCDLRQSALIRLFVQHSSVMLYLLDADGDLLVHSNPQYVMKKYNYSKYELVKHFQTSKVPDFQKEFTDEQGDSFLGAYSRTGIGGTAVFAQVDRSIALRAVEEFQYRSYLLTAVVLGLAFIFNFIFSKSMTSPLSHLYQATEKIAGGNFDVKLESQSHDEIGALTSAFKKMATGLQERDKLKSTFSKFHSKEIAQKILSGEIKLGGERKMATIFFSDIRNFTAMSERLTPDEVVNMLNEYMTEMVRIINVHHGVVDKYVGDAIMALWGVPNSTPDDAFQAISTCLDMRRALKQLNIKRSNRGQPELHIGMGLHTGEVLAGNIGSEERLEYTVIGDNVNQASRIESANKELSSDILISEATYTLIKNRGFVVGPPLPILVKGKALSLTVYQVIGKRDASGNVISDLSPVEQEKILNQLNEINAKAKVVELSENTAATVVKMNMPQGATPQVTGGHSVTQIVPSPGSGQHTGTNIPNYSPAVLATTPSQTQFAPTPKDYGPQEATVPIALAQTPSMQTSSAIFARENFSAVNFGISHQSHAGHPPAPGAPAPIILEETWFLVRNSNSPETEGPYDLAQLKLIAGQPGFNFDAAYVYRDGDAQMTPLAQVPGVSRRASRPAPSIQVAPPPLEVQKEAEVDEWYVYGAEDRTFGPYSVEQLRDAVDAGHLTRTTYVWRQGMESWIYTYQVPGFDRREPGRKNDLGPIPVLSPKKLA